MKKYIAPEMEIAKFAAEDVITTSVVEPKITFNTEKPSYNFEGLTDAAVYDTF